jgi:hypothetical protein
MLISYKKALCVTGPDALTNVFDSTTRDRLREFVAGYAWATSVAPGGNDTIDPTLETRLKQAITISPICSENGEVSSAYELGIYTRSGVLTANKEIEGALECLGLDAKLRGRAAFRLLRIRMVQAASAPVATGPAVNCPPLPVIAANAAGRDDLDPPLWDFTFKKSLEKKRTIRPKGPR